jgi:hypothetical protein
MDNLKFVEKTRVDSNSINYLKEINQVVANYFKFINFISRDSIFLKNIQIIQKKFKTHLKRKKQKINKLTNIDTKSYSENSEFFYKPIFCKFPKNSQEYYKPITTATYVRKISSSTNLFSNVILIQTIFRNFLQKKIKSSKKETKKNNTDFLIVKPESVINANWKNEILKNKYSPTNEVLCCERCNERLKLNFLYIEQNVVRYEILNDKPEPELLKIENIEHQNNFICEEKKIKASIYDLFIQDSFTIENKLNYSNIYPISIEEGLRIHLVPKYSIKVQEECNQVVSHSNSQFSISSLKTQNTKPILIIATQVCFTLISKNENNRREFKTWNYELFYYSNIVDEKEKILFLPKNLPFFCDKIIKINTQLYPILNFQRLYRKFKNIKSKLFALKKVYTYLNIHKTDSLEIIKEETVISQRERTDYEKDKLNCKNNVNDFQKLRSSLRGDNLEILKLYRNKLEKKLQHIEEKRKFSKASLMISLPGSIHSNINLKNNEEIENMNLNPSSAFFSIQTQISSLFIPCEDRKENTIQNNNKLNLELNPNKSKSKSKSKLRLKTEITEINQEDCDKIHRTLTSKNNKERINFKITSGLKNISEETNLFSKQQLNHDIKSQTYRKFILKGKPKNINLNIQESLSKVYLKDLRRDYSKFLKTHKSP